MDKCIIYGLIDPRTLLVRYVGKSCSGLRRPKRHGHAVDLARNRGHSGNWIRELRRDGLNFEIVVLEECVRDALADAERWWIAYGRACGWPLTNLTDGGDGAPGRPTSPLHKAQLRERNLRDNPSKRPEVKERLRQVNLGKRYPGRGDFLRAINTGRVGPGYEVTDAVRAKQSKSYNRSPEAHANRCAGQRRRWSHADHTKNGP